MAYRDSHGRTLEDYPRPSVAVDTAVLTLSDDALAVLLVPGDTGGWCLPGTFLHQGEALADAVRRSLAAKAGVRGLEPQQLHVFDAPDRDDRGWVLSVAHLDTIPAVRVPAGVRVVPVADLPPLPYDHAAIVDRAVATLRADYREHPDPAGLLAAQEFTVRDLRRLHEAVLGERLVPDTFRRTMLPGLAPTGEVRRGGRGKPAELYRRLG
ncbi:NUDIX hydrolase [Naumannella sp. ID2617S]|nr:NUDIX hydrolase [Naumannella sp. ID2617S]